MKKLLWKLLSFIIHACAGACIAGFGCVAFGTLLYAAFGDGSFVWPILCTIGTVASIVGLVMWIRFYNRLLSQPSALERAFADYDDDYVDEVEDEDFEPGSMEDFHALLAQNGTRFCCCLCETWQPRRKGVALIYEKTRGGLELSGALCSDCAVTYIPNAHEVMAEIRR